MVLDNKQLYEVKNNGFDELSEVINDTSNEHEYKDLYVQHYTCYN